MFIEREFWKLNDKGFFNYFRSVLYLNSSNIKVKKYMDSFFGLGCTKLGTHSAIKKYSTNSSISSKKFVISISIDFYIKGRYFSGTNKENIIYVRVLHISWDKKCPPHTIQIVFNCLRGYNKQSFLAQYRFCSGNIDDVKGMGDFSLILIKVISLAVEVPNCCYNISY